MATAPRLRKLRFGILSKLMIAIVFPLLLSTSAITLLNLRQLTQDKLKFVFYVIHLSTTEVCSDIATEMARGNLQNMDDTAFVNFIQKKYQKLDFSGNHLFGDPTKPPLIWDESLPKGDDFSKWLKDVYERPIQEATSEETWGSETYVVSLCKFSRNNMSYLSLHMMPKSQALMSVRQLAYSIIIQAVGALLMSIVIAWALAKNMSRPIHSLANASDEIAAGNFEYEWTIPNHDEIGLLSDHLNILRSRLRQREMELGKVSQLANLDHLTGIWNRRFLEANLENCMALANRHDRPLCAVYFDLDHFKKINDTYGHDAGDVVLKKVGALLRQFVRKTDLAARMGGEEFVVILQETDLRGALQFAQKFRAQLKAAPLYISPKGEEVRVTASIGIASRTDDGVDQGRDFLTGADQFAYLSKKNGRDRINSKAGEVK
jgi:diguanylate cyclase (GGDEF)-like protein